MSSSLKSLQVFDYLTKTLNIYFMIIAHHTGIWMKNEKMLNLEYIIQYFMRKTVKIEKAQRS